MIMRAIQVDRYGGPEVLKVAGVADPSAGPGQVVVEVAAADVLFLDCQVRGGWGEMFGVVPPYVPGNGVAGVVVSLGDGVDSKWLGRQVVAVTAAAGPQGGYAERAVVSESGLVAVPGDPGVGRQGLSLLHDGPTALTLARNAAIRPGEQVLVTGAAGGLGILLVQLALAAGGHVVAAARGERKLELLRSLGAEAVDYSMPSWTQIVRRQTGGTGPDVILDGVGGQIGQDAFTIIAPGGRFSAHGAPSGSFAQIDPAEAGRRSVTVRGIEQVQFDPADPPPLVEQALAEVSAGRLRPVIGQTFPLTEAAQAHRCIESRGTLGKTLLLP
jgi:NADPH:quinone reductase